MNKKLFIFGTIAGVLIGMRSTAQTEKNPLIFKDRLQPLTETNIFKSDDYFNWGKATEYVIQNKRISMDDGSALIPERMERPFLYQEEGEPKVLSMAVKKGDDAYIVFVPVQKHPTSP